MSDKLRIMIVDDSPNLRKVIMRYVSSQYSADFFEAGDGEEAERILQECNILGMPIDILFLDWMMPRISGYDFLKKIRGVEIFKCVPSIIMLSAETYADQINSCLLYGVDTYVTKPFTEEELAAAVAKILEGRGLKHAV